MNLSRKCGSYVRGSFLYGGMRCPLGFNERTVLSSSVEAALRDDLAGAV